MLKLAADENFDNRIIQGLLRRNAALDIVRIQDTDLAGADDPTVLAWAAREGRVLVTHDVNTVTRYANERIAASEFTPGVFEVSDSMPIGQAIEELLLLMECSREGEWEGRIEYLPLKKF
jgi:hypothetical protein